jgi:molybdopterin converting factor subunit 1
LAILVAGGLDGVTTEATLKIRTRFFASAREIVGQGSLELDAPEGVTAGDLLQRLAVEYPSLAAYGPHLALAVHAEYVDRDHPLRDGDELALIPPVSGG